MSEKAKGSLLGVSFLNINYIVSMTAGGNMGLVLFSVLHSALLVFHEGSKTADNLVSIFSFA